jgi:poly(A) polymerase
MPAFDSLLTPAARRLMSVIADAGGEARIVGGAVRDAVIGRAVGDIDMACTLAPDLVMKALTDAGIKAVPTGIAHGTITAVIDHTGYELTTLRRDVETDGRHARVEFTDDWRMDAARRDFTFNALYVDASGTLHDYVDGAADAKAGHVRFIGDAEARITEDVLRILRFFRFFAWFGDIEPDATGLAACRKLASLLPRLSAERVAKETLKLMGAPNPLPALAAMSVNEILAPYLPEAINVYRLRAALGQEKNHNEQQPPIVRLAALLLPDPGTANAVAQKLKLSRADAALLLNLSTLPVLLDAAQTPTALRRLIYAHGAEACRHALFLTTGDIAPALATIAAWENPVFPIRGEDLARMGIPAGPRMGEILRATEIWWIDDDFRATREACLAHAMEYGKNH